MIAIARKYEEFANENKGIFRIFYINCEKETKLCDTLKPHKMPVIRIYPPLPIPFVEMQPGEILESKKLLEQAAAYLPKPDIETLSPATITAFLESKPNKPKVLLFSEHKSPPFILKGIAHSFYDTMHVGFIPKSEEALVKRFKVTTFPSLILVRRKNEKPMFYKGEMKFNNIYDFLNPYSEKFISKDTKAQHKEEEQKLLKPWLKEEFPELTKVSAGDICFNTGKFCVIYLDKKEPTEDVKALLKKLKDKYATDNKFAYMWLNVPLEKTFFKIFQLDESEIPKLAFLNPGTLKRVLVHSGGLTEAELIKTYESIYNADARFTRISSKTLPELSSRDTGKSKSDL